MENKRLSKSSISDDKVLSDICTDEINYTSSDTESSTENPPQDILDDMYKNITTLMDNINTDNIMTKKQIISIEQTICDFKKQADVSGVNFKKQVDSLDANFKKQIDILDANIKKQIEESNNNFKKQILDLRNMLLQYIQNTTSVLRKEINQQDQSMKNYSTSNESIDIQCKISDLVAKEVAKQLHHNNKQTIIMEFIKKLHDISDISQKD